MTARGLSIKYGQSNGPDCLAARKEFALALNTQRNAPAIAPIDSTIAWGADDHDAIAAD
jgi:hypothetical protein